MLGLRFSPPDTTVCCVQVTAEPDVSAEAMSASEEMGAGVASGQAPAASPLDSGASAEGLRLLSAALASSDGGVPWPHVRLMVRGSGGAGKSSTIDAMAGRAFDAVHPSTVGATVRDVDLP